VTIRTATAEHYDTKVYLMNHPNAKGHLQPFISFSSTLLL